MAEVNQAEAVDMSVDEVAAFLAREPEPKKAAESESEQAEAEEPQAEEPEEGDEQGEEAEEAETETDEEDTEEESEEPQRYTVKVNGEERQVTLEELQKGYSMEADYRRKTTETANERRALAEKEQAFEAERQAVRAERERYAQILDRADQALKEQAEIAVDMDKVRAGDVAELAKYATRTETEKSRLKIAEQQRVLAEQQQREMEETRAKRINATLDELSSPETGLPGWTDGKTRQSDIDRMEKYLLEKGIRSESMIALSVDPAFIRVFHDAAQFAAMKAAKPATEKKAPPRRPIPAGGKPQTTASKDLQRAEARFGESGSIEDAAALLMRRKR